MSRSWCLQSLRSAVPPSIGKYFTRFVTGSHDGVIGQVHIRFYSKTKVTRAICINCKNLKLQSRSQITQIWTSDKKTAKRKVTWGFPIFRMDKPSFFRGINVVIFYLVLSSFWRRRRWDLGTVVQTLGSAIYWINYYPPDKYKGDQLCYQLRENDLSSLVPRPVRATRITRGGLKPSAIGRIFLTSLTGDVKSKIKRTTGNEAEIYLLDSVIQRLNNWGLVKSDLYTWLPLRNVRQTMRELMLEINLQFSTC